MVAPPTSLPPPSIRFTLTTLILFFTVITGITSAQPVRGFFNFEWEFTLNNDGSGLMKIIFAVDEALYESEEGKYLVDVIPDLFGEMEDNEGCTLIGGKEYQSDEMHIWESEYSFKDIHLLGDEEFQISFGPDGDTMVFDVNLLLPDEEYELFTEEEVATGESQAVIGLLASHHFKFQMTVPEVVMEAPGAKVTGKTAAWKIPLDRIFLSKEKAIRMRVVY